MCDSLDNDTSDMDVLTALKVGNPQLTLDDATKFAAIAVASFYPRYLDTGGDSN